MYPISFARFSWFVCRMYVKTYSYFFFPVSLIFIFNTNENSIKFSKPPHRFTWYDVSYIILFVGLDAFDIQHVPVICGSMTSIVSLHGNTAINSYNYRLWKGLKYPILGERGIPSKREWFEYKKCFYTIKIFYAVYNFTNKTYVRNYSMNISISSEIIIYKKVKLNEILKRLFFWCCVHLFVSVGNVISRWRLQ